MASDSSLAATAAALTDFQQSDGLFRVFVKKLQDGVSEASEPFKRIMAKSKVPQKSGDTVSWTIESQVQEAEYFSGGQKYTGAQVDGLKQMTDFTTQLTGRVQYFWEDLRSNEGNPDAVRNYMMTRVNRAMNGFKRTLIYNMYGNGSTRIDGTTIAPINGRPIHGFGYWVETTPASSATTIAGTARSSTTTWLNNQYTSLTSIYASLTSTMIHTMISMCTHPDEDGKESSPDLAICSDELFEAVWALAKAEKWPTLGSVDPYNLMRPTTIKLGETDIMSDKHLTGTSYGGLLTTYAYKMWFLNTSTFEFRVDPGADLSLGPIEKSESDETLFQRIYWRGQLINKSPRLNGLIAGQTG